jgi:dTDP-4-dehydrorhamnose reductase
MYKKRILITGSKGQLGLSLRKVEAEYESSDCYYTDIEELDITIEEDVNRFILEKKIEIIINCAAYTAVDKAETEFDLAKKINAEAVSILAKAAAKNNCFLFHVSTDYVFDGQNYKPYNEEDICAPLSAYGKSKLMGEKEILHHAKNAIILRTSWLYSQFGSNFLNSMLKYGAEKQELRVVFDQIGTPTYASRLARGIFCMIFSDIKLDGIQIYNFSNEGVCSWYDFASEIFDMASIDCKLIPITSIEYPLPAPRPFYSVLNKAKVRKKFQLDIPHWKIDLKECISAIEI